LPDLLDVKIVGFDLDGTLLDSSGDLANATNVVLAKLGRQQLTNAQVLPFIGLGPRHMLEQAFIATGGIPVGQFHALFGYFLREYENNIAVETKLFSGAMELLNLLEHRSIKFGVVTNKLEYLARKLLSELSILDAMSFVIGGDTLGPGNGKPSGKPIEEMISKCGDGRAVFVGDSIHDVAAAHNAGIACIVLRHGRDEAELSGFSADLTVADFSELRAVFDSHKQPPRMA
jgi:phosphoglycolate phosphatase